jgi:DNA-binding NarL/FixJ family response regulator
MANPKFPRNFKPLTSHSRELRAKILARLRKGISQNKISRELDISFGTVGYHVSVLRKSGELKR